MKKILASIIIFIIIVAAAVFFVVYRKKHQMSNAGQTTVANEATVAKSTDVPSDDQVANPISEPAASSTDVSKTTQTESDNNSGNKTESILGKGVEFQGKVIGIGEKNIAIDKPTGSEIFNIDASVPVFEKDGKTKGGLWEAKPGVTVKIVYDDSTRNAISITVLEK